jgi:hypothetical protein
MLIKTKLAVTTTREGARDAETLYIKFLTAEKASIYRLDVAFPVLGLAEGNSVRMPAPLAQRCIRDLQGGERGCRNQPKCFAINGLTTKTMRLTVTSVRCHTAQSSASGFNA